MHTITIHVATKLNEVEWETHCELTAEQAARLSHFLSLAHYGTVYPQMPSHGDGNKKGSQSDIETRETLAALRAIARAFEDALKP